jgi:hypothetical protein
VSLDFMADPAELAVAVAALELTPFAFRWRSRKLAASFVGR